MSLGDSNAREALVKQIKALISLLDRKDRWTLSLLLVWVCLSGPAEVLGVGAIVAFLGVVANPGIVSTNVYLADATDLLGLGDPVDFVTLLGISMVLVVTLSNALLALVNYHTLKFTWGLHRTFSVRLVSYYLKRDYIWFLGKNTAELSKAVLSEVQEIINGIFRPTIGFVSSIFRVVSIGLFLFVVEPKVALIVSLLGVGAFALLVKLTHRRQARLGNIRLTTLRAMYKMCSEMFCGIKELKLSGASSFLLSRFESQVRAYGAANVQGSLVSQLPKYLVQTLALSGVAVLSVFLFRSGFRDEEVFTTLAFFAVGGYRMMGTAQRAFAYYSNMSFSRAALEGLYRGLKPIEPREKESSVGSFSFEKEIQVSDLGFKYEGQDVPLFSGLNLVIEKNTKVAFVGSTGSGKTTLVNLILGLLEPSSGSVSIDGELLVKERVTAWQARIGYVPQDIFLLDDSVTSNIAFAVPASQIDFQAVKKAARIAQIDEFIQEELPAGFDTVIGERGARISGGQRQRIGIARALYQDPEILVFDEATSALDGETEEKVVSAIESLERKKTILVIAHRLKTVRNCDVIYVLRDGKLSASGTYQELMEHSEDFQDLMGSAAD